MKIGIITWFEYENYGTKLQAIALQSYLKKRDYTVELINYRVPEPGKSFQKHSFYFRLYRKLNHWVLQYAQNLYQERLKIRSERLANVIQEKCTLTEKAMNDANYIKLCNQFDLLICGSDQIWNPNWYHPYYYADFPEIKTKKVSYAPSVGICVIPENMKQLIKKSLKSFSQVTVREESAAALLEPLLGYRPKKVLDPTLLLSKQRWKEMFQLVEQQNQQYLLCYFLSDKKNHWAAARRFASKYNLNIKIIPQGGFSFFQKGELCIDAGVKEFLELILNAKYILTDSFHGTVFSLLFEKEVYVFERFREDQYHSQNDRVIELVNQFGINTHYLPYNSNTVKLQNPIDYQKVTAILDIWRLRSKEILKTELET